MLKCANLLYAFDFDGTLVGDDNWAGWFESVKKILKSRLYFNPDKNGIRWVIFTSRPKIDIPLIRFVCAKHNIKPQQIITQPTIFWSFKNKEEEYQFKINTLIDIIEKKKKITYTTQPIRKVIYIDNNTDLLRHINDNRRGYEIIGITVPDFIQQLFTHVLF